jgi:hypothetical protein
VPVDDAPTVSASGTNPTFTEDGSAVALFSGCKCSAIEAAQNIKSLTFTVIMSLMVVQKELRLMAQPLFSQRLRYDINKRYDV